MFVLTYANESGEVFVLAVSSAADRLEDFAAQNLYELGFDDTDLAWTTSKGAPDVKRAEAGADSYYEIVDAERI